MRAREQYSFLIYRDDDDGRARVKCVKKPGHEWFFFRPFRRSTAVAAAESGAGAARSLDGRAVRLVGGRCNRFAGIGGAVIGPLGRRVSTARVIHYVTQQSYLCQVHSLSVRRWCVFAAGLSFYIT